MRCAKYKRSFCDQLREKCKGAAQVNFRWATGRIVRGDTLTSICPYP